MQIPNSDHQNRPWRIHELVQDFRLEDVWALPAWGGPDDFPLLVESFAAGDPSRESHGVAHLLWAARGKLGEILGWDDEATGLGERVGSLRERLPADLAGRDESPAFDRLPFEPLYMLDREWAAELANETVHGVMHLGWVSLGGDVWRGEMAIYVKPNGLFGQAYMAAIRPFRHLLVYPPMMRTIERRWRAEHDARLASA